MAIQPLWGQMPLKNLWDNMPLRPLYPSDGAGSVQNDLQTNADGTTRNAARTVRNAGQIQTARQTQSRVADPVDTHAADLQANPWTAPQTVRSFGEIFQAALEQSYGPVAELAEPITDIFGAAIDAVKETDAQKTQMEYLMATGQLDNPALLSIASTKAQLSVQLLVQLRNRAVEAYNEVMRISI